jgi:hypothetical protein
METFVRGLVQICSDLARWKGNEDKLMHVIAAGPPVEDAALSHTDEAVASNADAAPSTEHAGATATIAEPAEQPAEHVAAPELAAEHAEPASAAAEPAEAAAPVEHAAEVPAGNDVVEAAPVEHATVAETAEPAQSAPEQSGIQGAPPMASEQAG